ncbi:hypothetical protein [Campylobacter jejuni]|uniref:hypothetical protein n=1 Tax=Campylobacter jejuni TaxID=197 RepID=UPI0014961A47|nr:hypothetical protein [Campylobacter jejuni]
MRFYQKIYNLFVAIELNIIDFGFNVNKKYLVGLKMGGGGDFPITPKLKVFF